MTTAQVPCATAACYRPLDYTETPFDPPIQAPEGEALFVTGSLAGGTVATFKPEDVIGIGPNIWIPFVPVVNVNRQHALAGYGFAPELIETTFTTIVVTGEQSKAVHWPPVAGMAPVSAVAPPAFRAFKDLVRWLDADDAQVSAAVGVGRTTPYSWRRDDREPRASTVRRLYEYHAVLSSLRRRLGEMEFRRWLFGDDSEPRARLLEGELEAVEGRVHELLFRRHDTGVGLGWAPEDAESSDPRSRHEPLRPSGRRPRRARLP
jgi:hypothetical protein